MPTIKCLIPALRDDIINFLETEGASKKDIDQVRELPSCDSRRLIEFERGRRSRAPTERNIFIGQCMRGGGKTMKQCSDTYKAQKN